MIHSGAAEDESSMLRCEMREQEKEAQELSSQIQQVVGLWFDVC